MKRMGKFWIMGVVMLWLSWDAIAQHDRYYYLMRSDRVLSGFCYEEYLPTEEVAERDSLVVRVVDELGKGMATEVCFVGFDDTVRMQCDTAGRVKVSQRFVDSEGYDFFYVEAKDGGYRRMQGWVHGYNINMITLAKNSPMTLVGLTIVLGKEVGTKEYTDVYMIAKREQPLEVMLMLQRDVCKRKLSNRRWQPLLRYDMVVGTYVERNEK